LLTNVSYDELKKQKKMKKEGRIHPYIYITNAVLIY